MIRVFTALLLLLLLRAGVAAPVEEHSNTSQPLAPLIQRNTQQLVPNQYGVRLKEGYTFEQHWEFLGVDLSKTAEWFVPFEWAHLYAVRVADASIIEEKARSDPHVLSIRQDEYLDIKYEERLGDPFTLDVKTNPDPSTSTPPNDGRQLWTKDGYWFNTMITAGKKQDSIPTTGNEYWMISDPTPAEGINIYIIDTGVMTDHVAFKDANGQSRASHFRGLKGSDLAPYCAHGETNQDENGHGTFVAAIAAGGIVGGAPKANIISVKVACKYLTPLMLMNAIMDVTDEHIANRNNSVPGFRGSVINMSLGSVDFKELEAACDYASQHGIPIVVAAGNDGITVDTFRLPAPCKYHSTWCVGAVDNYYQRWWWSNLGRQINVFAPGVNIVSASIWGGGFDKWEYQSGTSGAAPFVSAMMAIFISAKDSGVGWGPGVGATTGEDWYHISAMNVVPAVDLNCGFLGLKCPETTTQRLATTGLNTPYKGDNPYRKYEFFDKPADQRKCGIDVTQVWTCEPEKSNMYGRFTLYDPNKTEVYQTESSAHTLGVPINDGSPFAIDTNLTYALEISANQTGDYINFLYGGRWGWTSSTTEGSFKCDPTTQNWSTEGPVQCQQGARTRGFYCEFLC